MNKFFLNRTGTLDLFLHEARKPAISHLCCCFPPDVALIVDVDVDVAVSAFP